MNLGLDILCDCLIWVILQFYFEVIGSELRVDTVINTTHLN
jgi:hypothetical protein